MQAKIFVFLLIGMYANSARAQDFDFQEALTAWKRVAKKLDQPRIIVEKHSQASGTVNQTIKIDHDNYVIENLPVHHLDPTFFGEAYGENSRYLFALKKTADGHWVAKEIEDKPADHLSDYSRVFRRSYSRWPLRLDHECDVLTVVESNDFTVKTSRVVNGLVEIEFDEHPDADPTMPTAKLNTEGDREGCCFSNILIRFDPQHDWIPVYWAQKFPDFVNYTQRSDLRRVDGVWIPFSTNKWGKNNGDDEIVKGPTSEVVSLEFSSFSDDDFSLVSFGLPEYGQPQSSNSFKWAFFWLAVAVGISLIAFGIYRLRNDT